MDIQKEIVENQIVLFMAGKDQYITQTSDIIKILNEISEKIAYVTFNQPYASVASRIQNSKLDINKFFFIDTVTKSVQEPTPVDNCTFISAPNALTEISVAFSKALQDQNCKSAIFDSLSALLVYESVSSIIQFTHNIITKLRVGGNKAVFIALKEDTNSDLMKDLYMFVDKVIE